VTSVDEVTFNIHVMPRFGKVIYVEQYSILVLLVTCIPIFIIPFFDFCSFWWKFIKISNRL